MIRQTRKKQDLIFSQWNYTQKKFIYRDFAPVPVTSEQNILNSVCFTFEFFTNFTNFLF